MRNTVRATLLGPSRGPDRLAALNAEPAGPAAAPPPRTDDESTSLLSGRRAAGSIHLPHGEVRQLTLKFNYPDIFLILLTAQKRRTADGINISTPVRMLI